MSTVYHPLTDLLVLDLLAGGPGSGCRGPRCGRPKGVKQVYQTAAGFNYTILKPSRKGIPKGQQTRKKWNFPQQWDEKALKGEFKPARDPQTNKAIKFESKDRYSNVYDAKFGRGDVYEGHGITAFVHRDFKNVRVVVQVVPHDEMDHSAVAKVYKFKNFGQAAGFLNKRFGIRQKLPRAGGRG